MDAVHWWALFGLATTIFGVWLIVLSHAQVMRAVCERDRLRRQVDMLGEALALYEYGARNEAFEMLDRVSAENVD